MSYNPAINCGLGSSRFARRYSGNRFFFLFLRVLRCFSSPGLPSLRITTDVAGFPHSEISGSMLTYSSPEHIGVSPVLHRLLVPRHPPCALHYLIVMICECTDIQYVTLVFELFYSFSVLRLFLISVKIILFLLLLFSFQCTSLNVYTFKTEYNKSIVNPATVTMTVSIYP